MDNARYYKRTVIKEQILSQSLDETRSIRVFLPPSHDKDARYSVIYCQDGEDAFRMGRIVTHAMRLILDDGLKPTIIVGVDVDKKKRTEEYSPGGIRSDAYSRFFDQELVPYIEENFAAGTDCSERILAGVSLGAAFSLNLALEHPERYAQLILLSGAYLSAIQQRVKNERDLSSLDLYMAIGFGETEVQTERGTFDFLTLHRNLVEELQAKKAHLSVKESEGRHIWGFWQEQLPDALTYFLG